MIKADQPTIFDTHKISVVLSSKSDGNTRPEWGPQADVEQAVGKIAHAADVSPEHVIVMDAPARQGAWDEITDITSAVGRGLSNPDERVQADAMVTNVPGAALFLPVADCNAVVIHDLIQHVAALVRLGWRSTVAQLATKIVEHLQQKYHSSAPVLRVYFSPAIKAESYAFDTIAQADDPLWKEFLRKSEKGIGVDLPGFNRQRFIDAGVLAEHIELSPVNTATSDNYFSHYRSVRSGEPEGRFGVLACLK